MTSVGRRTKIIATLGPATDDTRVLDGLLLAGVDVCRVNLSHGSIESSLARVAQVREAAARSHRYVGVLCDLPGPKIRTALFVEDGVQVAPGDRLRLVDARPDGTSTSDASVIAIDLDGAVRLLQAGDIVSLGDGGVELVVIASGED